MDNKAKTHENLLRRRANRRGLTLRRSPRRDRRAVDYGQYALSFQDSGGLVHPDGVLSIYAMSLEEVEAYLDA